MNRTTGYQVLLLVVAGLAISVLVLLAISSPATNPAGPGAGSAAATNPAAGPSADPVRDFIRYVYAISDSLHDEAEEYLIRFGEASDTTGLEGATRAFDVRTRAVVETVQARSLVLPESDARAVLALFLSYLDVPLAFSDPADARAQAAAETISLLDSEREALEPLLSRYLGLF